MTKTIAYPLNLTMTKKNPYGRRKLPYPYSYLTRQEYDASSLDVDADAIDQTGSVVFVIEMTPDEILRFSSALTAGADLIYPDDQVNVIAPYLRARTMSICDAVADCIENNLNVQSAIADQILNNEKVLESILNAGAGIGISSGQNSDDAVYGASLSLANYIQNTLIDVAETVQAAAELAEAFTGALGIKGLTNLPVARVASFVTELSDAGAASVIAEADASTLETLTCYIFNTIRCDEAGIFSFNALRSNLNELVVSLGLSKAAYSTSVVALFNVLPEANFSRYYAIGLNDPSNDWQSLCVPCPSGPFTTVFDLSQGSASAYTIDRGVQQVNRVGGAGDGTNVICRVIVTLAATSTVDGFSWRGFVTSSGTFSNYRVKFFDGLDNEVYNSGDINLDTTVVSNRNVPVTSTANVAYIELRLLSSQIPSGSNAVETITVSGTR